ncbi:hypothetical protein AKO1_014763 [Acrasis kona]|uniref:Protein MEMO1 n=1 Tax=Acrasis kona TaxID=1008807 RepID=A0AAW2Z361_9EUKA
MKVIRRATHAGSWYTGNSTKLNDELDKYLGNANLDQYNHIRAIIGPHAGFRYCGPTGAYAYKAINTTGIKRVFILGPSHHVYLNGCAISRASKCETPLGHLQVDVETVSKLSKTDLFKQLTIEEEEDEHSLEMHMPWVAKTFDVNHIKVVPIMVGQLPDNKGHVYGELLRPYLEDEENFFVISSDFCHWGQRFSYQYYDKTKGAIHESIKSLDRLGMEAIESLDPDTFTAYLKKFKNTICGRNPILLLLHCVKKSELKHKMEFVDYSQSSECEDMEDSSVSYASGILYIE